MSECEVTGEYTLCSAVLSVGWLFCSVWLILAADQICCCFILQIEVHRKNENITYVHVEQTASHNLLWFDLHVLPLVVHIYTLIYITFKVSQQDSSEFIIILNV